MGYILIHLNLQKHLCISLNLESKNYFVHLPATTREVMRPQFEDIFMELAVNLANRSHCIKRHVGAVLTKDTRIISIGYNGPPSGTHNCDEEWPETGCSRDSKGSCSLALHAEQNAIIYAVKNGTSIDGSTLYVTLSPCLACARIIYSVGIKKVVYLHSYAEYKGYNTEDGLDFLSKFGVEVEKYSGNLPEAHTIK